MKISVSSWILSLAFAVPAQGAAKPADDPALSIPANQAFVAANAHKQGVVTLPDGLQFRVLQNGTGKHPGLTDTVQINFTARLINGTLFDGTSPGLPASVPVNNLIRGLNEALQKMRVGDHWQIVVPTELAYGPRGSSNGTVPPNQALVFDVSLVSATPAPATGADQATTLSVLSGNNAHAAILTIHP
jgi:FKBP-type peptidyl-prolyl cis-trans isomerase